jgi:hypothetical protein
VERSRPEWFEMKVAFTVPDLTGDFYPVVVFNDPCTISGFKEPLSGLVSIVQTAREGALLTQRQRLLGRIYSLHRHEKKTEKALADLNARFVDTNRVRLTMANELTDLQHRLASTAPTRARTPDRSPRPLLSTGTGIALVLVLLMLAAVVAARRRPAPSGVRSPS